MRISGTEKLRRKRVRHEETFWRTLTPDSRVLASEGTGYPGSLYKLLVRVPSGWFTIEEAVIKASFGPPVKLGSGHVLTTVRHLAGYAFLPRRISVGKVIAFANDA